MDKLENLMAYHRNEIALYGLSTETERFLKAKGKDISVVGILDGFRVDGELYGYPIISLEEAILRGVKLILVIARPGSCKAIAKRIGDVCRERRILLYDVRGKDLLESPAVSYDFRQLEGESKARLLEQMEKADVVSFDLFDTLIMRRVLEPTDIFSLVDEELIRQGILIPDFVRLRLAAEKELSWTVAPRLEAIYENVLQKAGGAFVSAAELAEIEQGIDASTILARESVCRIFRSAVAHGKRIIITTDSYYGEAWLRGILCRFGLDGYERVFVSCEYGTAKAQHLFKKVCSCYGDERILHVGNDIVADIRAAKEMGMAAYHVYSSIELFDALGGMGMEGCIESFSDRIKAGLFISRIFNDPFVFDTDERKVAITNSYDIGYLLYAPIITDFVLWLKQKFEEHGIQQILFCARDGYLIGRMYREIDRKRRSIYFLTSRTAAIRAGIEDKEDIAYVEGMKYSGTSEECISQRFGIDLMKTGDWRESALRIARERCTACKEYIQKLSLQEGEIGVFDFVAKGTTQFYLQRLLPQHLKGFYFLRLEPEYMADKHLDIEAFFMDEERDFSEIFGNYYFLETILTSLYPTVEEFKKSGMPVFGRETRSNKTLEYVREAQTGILDYFTEYMSLIPENARKQNKDLDERMLALIHTVCITDEKFLSLMVEDPFFGRNTSVRDLL